MKNVNVTYNKIVTVIETPVKVVSGNVTEGKSVMISFRTKKEFFDYAKNQEAMNIMVSQNLKGFQKKMESLGFDINVNKEWSDETRTKLYCSK